MVLLNYLFISSPISWPATAGGNDYHDIYINHNFGEYPNFVQPFNHAAGGQEGRFPYEMLYNFNNGWRYGASSAYGTNTVNTFTARLYYPDGSNTVQFMLGVIR
jgi:hypothetical protein